ncbi:hypothetical protein MRX96_010188 [Rhipicephalus microplus]
MGRMRAKRSPSTEATNKRHSWVACTSCDVRIDIEDTPFETVEEASMTAHYDCKQCVLREEFALFSRQQKRFRELLNEGRCACRYGDKNAFRMRHGTLRAVKWNRLVPHMEGCHPPECDERNGCCSGHLERTRDSCGCKLRKQRYREQ